MNLIPLPKVVRETGPRFPMAPLQLKDAAGLPNAASVFQDYASEMPPGEGKPLQVALTLLAPRREVKAVRSDIEETLPKSDEGYVLTVEKSGVNAYSRSERGLIYAIHTLFQLVENEQGRRFLPSLRIDDWPDFAMRGLMDDISRLQVSRLDNFKRIIRELSRLKYNYYCLYMEDMFRFEKHPSIGAAYGALTKEEARAIVEEGKRYAVEVVPHLQALGHLTRVLALPNYRQYGEHTRGPSHCLAVADQRIYPLLADWYEELFEVFDSKYIHIGCDEVHEMGTGRSKQLVQEKGRATVYVDHLLRVADIIEPYGRQVLFWGDMLNPRYGHSFEAAPEHLQRLRAAGLIFVNWDYYLHKPYEYFPYVNLLNREGLRQVIGPGIWGWRQIFPSYEEMADTLPHFAEVALAENVREALVTSWCDAGDNLREDHYHNYAYAAECLWNLAARDRNPASFSRRFCSHFYGSAPDALVEAHVLLGHLNQTLYGCARHDPRFPARGDLYRCSNWYLFWERPTPRAGKREDGTKTREVASQARALGTRLRATIKDVPKNRANVESLVFALRRLEFAASTAEFAASPTANKARALANHLSDLKHEFSQLWLRTNKPERLDIIEAKFDDLISWWRDQATR